MFSLFLIKLNANNFVQGLWEDTRKPNHNLRSVRKIAKLEYLIRLICPNWPNVKQFMI